MIEMGEDAGERKATPEQQRILIQAQLAKRELARRSLLQFTKQTLPTYTSGWVHDDIAKRLERFSKAVAAKKSPRLMLLAPPRSGKLCAHNVEVLTTAGWTTHGELRVGDEVFSPSGLPTKVVALSEDGEADHEVEFFDGSKFLVHGNHEWTVFDRAAGQRRFRTLETKFLAGRAQLLGSKKPRARYLVPEREALQYPEQALPVEPYFLGAWLGDGCSTAPVICGAESDLDDILTRIPYERGYRSVHKTTGVVYQGFKGVISAMKALGIVGRGAKRVPEAYKISSETQRRELLAGLVDTDGHLDQATGRISLTSASWPLVNDVADLVRSLGYRASICRVPPDTRERIIKGGEYWIVQWTPHDGRGAGHLPRKQQTRMSRTRRRVGVKSVTRIQTPLPGRCIQVAADDGLYLVGRGLIPTHNSELASIRFPAWHLGHYPHHEIINAGYNMDLPMIFSRKVREVLRSPHYQGIFQTRLDPNTQSVEAWMTTKVGGFVAAGVGSGITGKGASVFIIDDPIKNAEEADNPDRRDLIQGWYESAAYTRLAPGGGVLIIQTCWSDDDLAGRLQNKMRLGGDNDQFEIVKYPALAENFEYRIWPSMEIIRTEEFKELELIPALSSDPQSTETIERVELLRSPGEALHPERYPTEALRRIKANVDPRVWSALYQQNPVPDEGMFFNKDQFREMPAAPETRSMRLYTAWDFAIGEKQVNDWTVGVTIAQDHNDTLFVIEVNRFKGDSFRITEEILDTASRYANAGVDYKVGVEDGQLWRAFSPLVSKRMNERKQYPSIEVMKPLSDKTARARPLQGRMQQGRLLFPSEPSWYPTLRQEMLRFPAGVHDDQVDALAWAVRLVIASAPPAHEGERLQPKHKSWRDRLFGTTDGGWMSS